MRLRRGKNSLRGCVPSAYSLMMAPRSIDLLGEALVLGRIDEVEAAGQHADRAAAGLERGAMGDRIDAAREAADDGDPVRSEPARHLFGDLASVDGDAPRTDDGDGPLVGGRQRAADEEHRRPVVDLEELLRVSGVVPGDRLDAMAFEPLELAFRVYGGARGDART